jgi:hypothetical protein
MTDQIPEAGSEPIAPYVQPPQSDIQPNAQIQPGAQQTKPQRNILALVAFIVSVVGFIFACIPGALIIGWILLPIAFILAIVSLFMKGKGKGLGIAGLIISVVGTIVAFVVFFAVVAASFSSAFDQDTTVVETPSDSGEAPAAEEPATEVGTRENPAAIGSTIAGETWSVVVNSYSTDASAAVAANSFNEAAPAGSHYEIVNYTVTYTGAESAIAAEVTVDVVTGSGNVINSFDKFVILDDSMGLDELFNGASATGSAAFLIPDGESVLIRVQPGFFTDEVFVAP